MIKEAFIQEYGNGKIEPEHKDILAVLEANTIPVKFFTQKILDRKQLKLDKNTLVVGETHIVLKALSYLGITKPPPNSYPICLQQFLKRKIWESTVRELVYNLRHDMFESGVFAKPKSDAKKFTGCVLNSLSDLYKLQNASLNTSIYCSELVEWKSEYRVFVVNSKIVGIKNYAGSNEISLDISLVEEAIQIFGKTDERTIAYGIDFGIMKNNETALIEWNDGYSLGSYGLEKEIYTDLIIKRWEELTMIL